MDKYELCKVCVHTGNCEHQRGREQQVFQCEEFKGERPKARKSNKRRRSAVGHTGGEPVRSL